MKKIILIITLFVAVSNVQAQQLQSSAFYETQSFIHNPSFAGFSENNFIGANYRTQWANLNADPKTATIYGSFALPKQKLGIGGYVYNDKTGPTSRTGVSISVSKQIKFGDDAKLSFGIENRFQQFMLDQTKLTEYLGADPAIGNANKSVKYDAGFGISYTNKRLQLGVSVAQMLQSRFTNYTGNLNSGQEARLYRHYYATGSYKVDLDETISMVPNFMVIYFPNAPTEFNFGSRFKYADICWLGLSTSLTGNANFAFGLHVTKDITVDYAFDVYNNPADNFNYQAHEFMLRYYFKK
jgi:type IX secretion system PorP/SprF family membrane protein